MRRPKLAFIKYSIITFICASAILISGCGDAETDMMDFFRQDLLSAMNTRFDLNEKYAKRFQEAGILSQNQYNKIMSVISSKRKNFVEEGDLATMLNDITNAVSFYKTFKLGVDGDNTLFHAGINTLHIHTHDIKDDKSTDDVDESELSENEYPLVMMTSGIYKYNSILQCTRTGGIDNSKNPKLSDLSLSSFVAGNYMATHVDHLDLDSDDSNIKNEGIERNNITPIQLFNDDLAKDLNESAHAEVYVLKPDIVQAEGCNTIDGLLQCINEALALKNPEDQAGKLNKYFIPAYEITSTGNEKIYLIDNDAPNVDDYNMVVTDRPYVNENKLGYDLSIDQHFGEQQNEDKGCIEDMIRVRFTEFNEDAVEKLLAMEEDDTFLLLKDNKSDWKAYYMVYPISVIDQIQDTSGTYDYNQDENIDEATTEVSVKQSGLGINLKKGTYVKYKVRGIVGSNIMYDYNNFIEIDNNDYYFKLNSAQNNNEDGIAPIIINGYNEEFSIKQLAPNSVHSANPPKTVTARLVLTDYLEGTFAPGFVENEKVVAFGRKIRFDMSDAHWYKDETEKINYYYGKNGKAFQNKLYYYKGEPIAYYIDKEGNKIETESDLEITDFSNFLTLSNINSPVMKSIAPKDQDIGEVSKGADVAVEDLTAANIAKEYVEDINPVNMFPGNQVAKLDYKDDNTPKQRMYIITTIYGLFDNALYSDWVASTSQTASLEWWNQYLSNNNFQYDVGQEKVLDLIADNYAYERSQSGIVILDLDTVAKIQKQYDKEESESRTSWLRTFFMLLGWGLILYSTLMMLAWVIDANFDIGVKLLDKLTFGNWVAVKYEEDVPYRNTNDQTFLDQKKMYVRAAIMIGVGIFLINVNIFNVVLTLIDVFGRAAAKVEEVIQGFR